MGLQSALSNRQQKLNVRYNTKIKYELHTAFLYSAGGPEPNLCRTKVILVEFLVPNMSFSFVWVMLLLSLKLDLVISVNIYIVCIMV